MNAEQGGFWEGRDGEFDLPVICAWLHEKALGHIKN